MPNMEKKVDQWEKKVREISADLKDLKEHGSLNRGVDHQIKKLDDLAADMNTTNVQGSGTGRT